MLAERYPQLHWYSLHDRHYLHQIQLDIHLTVGYPYPNHIPKKHGPSLTRKFLVGRDVLPKQVLLL